MRARPAEPRPAAPGWVPTPPALARLAAERLAPHLPERTALLDPACGEGALLGAALEVLPAGIRPAALHGIELDPARARSARRRLEEALGQEPPRSTVDVRVGDALARRPAWPAATAVIANPPWVSYSGRQAAPDRPGAVGAGWPSLHGAFLERIAAHVQRTDLPAAVLAPASVIELERYRPLREALDARVRMLEPPLELGERAFPGVLGAAVLLVLGPARGRRRAQPWRPDPADADLRRLLARLPRLPAGSFADPGVHTGNAAAALLRDGPGPGRVPVRRGRDLQPYALSKATQWLRTDLEPAPGRRFRRGPLERYAAFPLLLRQTADRPLAALHEPPEHFRNSLLAGRAVAGLDPAVLVAVLNGPVAAFWHRAHHLDARQRTFPQVKVGHLGQQPMPFVRREAAPGLHDELARRVRALAPERPGFQAELRRIEDRVLAAFDLPPAAVRAIRGRVDAGQPPSAGGQG